MNLVYVHGAVIVVCMNLVYLCLFCCQTSLINTLCGADQQLFDVSKDNRKEVFYLFNKLVLLMFKCVVCE